MLSMQSRVQGAAFGRVFVAAGKISVTAAESQKSLLAIERAGETTAPKKTAWGDLLALAAVCQLD